MKISKLLRQKNIAFTLAEVVIVMGILGVMMAAFAPVVTKRTLSAGANTFQNFNIAGGHIGLSYGIPNDVKSVIIGDASADNTLTKTPKLLLMTNATNSGGTSPHIMFGTFGGANRIYGGELIMHNSASNSTIVLGGTPDDAETYTQFTNVIAIGKDACVNPAAGGVAIDNVMCLGHNSGAPAGNFYKLDSIYLGDKTTDYSANDIFFGTNSLSTMITENAIPSDIRLKNVGKEFTSGLDEINKLEFYNYTYKRDAEKDPKVGIMAQDLQKVFPNAVKENKDGYLYIRKDEMFYAALNAIKELSKKFTTNDEKIKALEERNTMLEQQNKELQELYIELSKRVDKLDKKKTKGKLTITPTEVKEQTEETTVNTDVEVSEEVSE